MHQRNTGDMKILPPNMTLFAPIGGLAPSHKVDQTMTRGLREFADRRGWSVEDPIHEALEQYRFRQSKMPDVDRLNRHPALQSMCSKD